MADIKITIGWEEWCAFPELGLPAIKAKVDTGAKTSCLHAYKIKTLTKQGQKYVRFTISPLQRNKEVERVCEAPISDHRTVTSSNGEREKRYVIMTPLVIGGQTIQVEVTLTSRHAMRYRMLLGRDALRSGGFVVDPAESFVLETLTEAETLYTATTGET